MTAPTLPRDLALLDLISEVRSQPALANQVRERAQHLAEVHQVATPAEVDRALATLTPAHQAYAWNRPETPAEREARHIKRKRDQAEVEAKQPKGRWYQKIDEIAGMLLATVASTAIGLGSIVILTMTPGPFEIPAGNWISGVLLLIVTSCFVGGTGLRVLHDRWQASQEQARECRHRCEAEDACEHSVTPTAAQAERWLAFAEVATQARAWMSSEIGLMAEDVRRLDARVAELTKAAQKNRQTEALAQLRAGLIPVSRPTEGASA